MSSIEKREALEIMFKSILEQVEPNANGELREGLVETPKRVAKAFETWFGGYDQSPADVLKVFKDGAEGTDEMVVVRNIPVWSHCEHHMAPFFGTVTIAYIPDDSIVGLSKFTRLVEIFSRRLQVQERLTTQIAEALEECLKPKGAAVYMTCRHTCVESRGVRSSGQDTVTSKLTGVFKTDGQTRSEFMSIAVNASL